LISPISARVKATTLCYHLTADKAMICELFLIYQRFLSRWRSLGESNPCFSLERAKSIRSMIILKGVRRTFPFIRFGIQLCHALLTTILLRHSQLHRAGMITFSDALFNGH
jgi:hypothetical protein